LGRAVAGRFATEGARIAVVYRDRAELEALLSELPGEGSPLALKCDVTVESQVASTMDQVNDRLGGPDILLNLVGAYAGGAKLVDSEEALWDRMMTVNLKSVFLCAKHALRHMIPQDYGRIISISSKAAIDPMSRCGAYAVSKAGVINVTQCIAREVRGTGVAAMAVVPSTIDTPANRRDMPEADFSKWVPPEQIADVLVHLSSEGGGALNGAAVPVYGGL
jgi:NAD(P)-dependent dehydrogenase (short-subunit alcohol dehydrogenase family)